jgi:cell division septum initiation protein DivIVA
MSSGRRPDPSKQQQELRATTAERLEAIVEAAERAAEGVIDDAETQARRYLAQARAEAERVSEVRITELSALIDVLLGRAAALRSEAEQLQTTLEEAKFRIDPEQPAAPSGEPLQPVEPAPRPEVPRLRAVVEAGAPAAPEAKAGDAAGARLLATQLAVSGSSREEIEDRLRNRFEIEDTSAILDAILGPEE